MEQSKNFEPLNTTALVKGLETGASKLDSAMDHALDAAAETSARAAEKLSELADGAVSLGEDGFNAVSKAIERNPITAIALAAGAGVILGLMCRGGSR